MLISVLVMHITKYAEKSKHIFFQTLFA